MNVLVIEDEQIAREGLERILESVLPDAKTDVFENCEAAMTFVRDNTIDIAFLDIHLKEVNGMEFALLLRHYSPGVRIIFTTGYTQYAADAYNIHADGYIVKPVTKEKVQREIRHLGKSTGRASENTIEFTSSLELPSQNRLRVQTFGNFEVFIDGVPAHFQYQRTKELFAYLIDRRGALCTNGEIISILWEDASYNRNSYLKNLKSDLKKVLEAADCGNAIVQQKGQIGILPQKIDCDYFDFMFGKKSALNMFRGEYMAQYSWAETTLSFLIRMASEAGGE